jgi:hypothetical protein
VAAHVRGGQRATGHRGRVLRDREHTTMSDTTTSTRVPTRDDEDVQFALYEAEFYGLVLDPDDEILVLLDKAQGYVVAVADQPSLDRIMADAGTSSFEEFDALCQEHGDTPMVLHRLTD